MASTRKGYLAVKSETTVATAVKPTNFIRYKEGDIMFKQEVLANDPVQNNRWLAISPVAGKVTAGGKLKIDLDPTEAPWFLFPALGTKQSTDISSLVDSSVFKHTLTLADSLPALSIETGKGNLTDTTNNRQNYTVERAFGCLVDGFTLAASKDIVDFSVDMKAHGLFQRAKVITDEDIEVAGTSVSGVTWAGGVATFSSTTHLLAINDLVVITGMTPSGYNGAYRVATVPTGGSFTVPIASNPGAFSAGGTVTKQSQFGCDTVEGLAVGDVVSLVELTTPTVEQATITVVDTIGKQVGFAAITSALFTVANGAKIELVPQTPSYTVAPRVLTRTHCTFRFSDTLANALTAASENVENWEFSYSNGLEERFGSLRASPSVIAAKGAKATLKFTKYFENVTDRDRFRDQTKRGGVLTISNNEIVSATDTNQAKYTITVKMNNAIFTSHEMPTGTDALYAEAVEITCFYDITDGAAMSVEVINQKNASFY